MFVSIDPVIEAMMRRYKCPVLGWIFPRGGYGRRNGGQQRFGEDSDVDLFGRTVF
jgi:hypothetical protein